MFGFLPCAWAAAGMKALTNARIAPNVLRPPMTRRFHSIVALQRMRSRNAFYRWDHGRRSIRQKDYRGVPQIGAAGFVRAGGSEQELDQGCMPIGSDRRTATMSRQHSIEPRIR